MRSYGLIHAEPLTDSGLHRHLGITRLLPRHRHFNIEHGIQGIFPDPAHRVITAERDFATVPNNRCQRVHLIKTPFPQITQRQFIVVKPGGRRLCHGTQLSETLDIGRANDLNMANRRSGIALRVADLRALNGVEGCAHGAIANRVQVQINIALMCGGNGVEHARVRQ